MSKILALSGSFRDASYNTALLRAAIDLAPEGVEITIREYRDVPMYDADLDTPASVESLKADIASADAVLFACPEYNYSVPGVLKNAVDWASRPAYKSPFAGKKTGVISASMAITGGARGQQHLKGILLAMAAPVYAAPEVCVSQAQNKFEDGILTDTSTREALSKFLSGFGDWVG